MICDMLHQPYISTIRDAAGVLYKRAWVLLGENAKPLPFPHAFGSWLYYPDGDLATVDIGELPTEELVWSPFKELPSRVCSACYVGDADWFLGDWPSDAPPVDLAPDGFAVDCDGGCMGCVHSVNLAAAGEFVVTGAPITNRGTISLDWALVPAGYVLSGPTSGPDAAPTFKPFSGGASAPLTLQPPLDSDFALALKQHSPTQSAPLLETLDSTGATFGPTIGPLGDLSNPSTPTSSGANNERFGQGALSALSTGIDNTAVGSGTLASLMTGDRNTAVGRGAGALITSGYNNVAVGVNALASDTTGYSNVAVGRDALASSTTGGRNTAIGYSSMSPLTTGYGNVGLGALNLSSNLSGNHNVAVGNYAGTNLLGNKNTAIGYYADAPGGPFNYCTIVGAGAVGTASNQIMLGRAADTVEFPGNAHFSNPPTGIPAGPGDGQRITGSVPNTDTVVLAISNSKGMQFVAWALDTGSNGFFVKADITDMTGTTYTGTSAISAGTFGEWSHITAWAIFGLQDKGPIQAFTLYLRAPSGTEPYDLRYTWVGPG